MARLVRSEFEGAWYHVMARGNRQEPIFEDDEDCESMLEVLGDVCGRTGWQVHAWVLMRNHYHFVLHTPEANLVTGMKWFMNTYTRRFNCRHRQWGRLFGDRYKALVIEPPEQGGEKDYLRSVIWYVHLNPVRAGLVKYSAEGNWVWESYRWNSLVQGYLCGAKQRATWMHVEMSLGMEQCTDTPSGRRRYRRIADGRAEAWKSERSSGREPVGRKPSTGWYLGGEGFRDWLLDGIEKRLVGRSASYRSSDQAHEHGERRAKELLESGCRFFGWDAAEMKGLRGGDMHRLLLAELIKQQTSVSQKWIAEHLSLKSAGNVSQQLRRLRLEMRPRLDPQSLKRWNRFVKNV
jgi:REP element-mobilizing transposase RayT